MKTLLLIISLMSFQIQAAEIITIKSDTMLSGSLSEVVAPKSRIILTTKKVGYSEPYEVLVVGENGGTVLTIPVSQSEYERIKGLLDK